jgi:hypothetical protein
VRISLLVAAVIAFGTLSFADGIQLTVYGAPLSSSIANPVDITFLMGIGVNDGPRSVITKQLGFPYTSIVFSLPAQPIGYYVGPAEGALYIWLAPDTTSINLLPMARLFAPPAEQVTAPVPFVESTTPDTGTPPLSTAPPAPEPTLLDNPPASDPPVREIGAVPVASVPEPSAYALLAVGFGAAMCRARWRSSSRTL